MEEGSVPSRLPRTMVGATAALVVLSLGLTAVAGPVFGYTGRAAHDLLDRGLYVSSVLSGGSR
jgi:multicomponent Na+:H+ antiporter subunit D